MTRHPDILDDAQAVAYLGLDACADKPEAQVRILNELARKHNIPRIQWTKKFLWSRRALEQFIETELGALKYETEK